MTTDKTAITVRAAVDRFLASPRCRQPTTRRSYGGTLDRVAGQVGPGRPLREVAGDEVGPALTRLWAAAAPATWNQRRAAVASFLAWCARNGYPAPALPAGAERQTEHRDETRAVGRPAVERLLTRRDIPLREKTLWRMLYETAARASEVLALNIEHLELEARRARVIAKGIARLIDPAAGAGLGRLAGRAVPARRDRPAAGLHRMNASPSRSGARISWNP